MGTVTGTTDELGYRTAAAYPMTEGWKGETNGAAS